MTHLRVTTPGLNATTVQYLGTPRLLVVLSVVDQIPGDDHPIQVISLRVNGLDERGQDLHCEDLLRAIGAHSSKTQSIGGPMI